MCGCIRIAVLSERYLGEILHTRAFSSYALKPQHADVARRTFQHDSVFK
jgi:hypothetical protein